MNRAEAVRLLREILASCDGLSEASLVLIPPKGNDVLSQGYQIHIKSWSSLVPIRSCMAPLVERQGLAVLEGQDEDLLIIYKPSKV